MVRPAADGRQVSSDLGFGLPSPRRRMIVLPGAGGTPEATDDATQDLPGDVTGGLPGDVPAAAGYETVAELGRGAGSVVHHVRHAGADYTFKVFAAQPDPVRVADLVRRRAELLAGATHPGLPITYEIGVVGAHPYVVTDLVPGLPLTRLLDDAPPAPDAVLALARDLAGMLDIAHRRGVAHGRIMPENVIVAPDGVAHLVDFAAAPQVGAVGVGNGVGHHVGASGAARHGDLLAVGDLLFRCLVGRPPMPGETEVGDPRVPAALAAAIARLLAPDPGDRYPRASTLLAALGGPVP